VDKPKTGDLVYVKVYPDVVLFSHKSIPLPTNRYVAWGYKSIKDFFYFESNESGITVEAIEKKPLNGVLLCQKEYSLHKYHHTYNILLFYQILVSERGKTCIPLWFPEEDVCFEL